MSRPTACISMQAAATRRFSNLSPITHPSMTPKNWPDGHERDDERSLRDRVAETFLDVRDRVHVDGGHDEEREAVAERDQPERARSQCFARRERAPRRLHRRRARPSAQAAVRRSFRRDPRAGS